MTGSLNGDGQLALMAGTGAGYTAGQNLRALRNKAAELCNILVIDRFYFIYAEGANLFAALAPAGTAVRPLGSIVAFSHGRSSSEGISSKSPTLPLE